MRILVVDDDKNVLRGMTRLLHQDGHTTATATDGNEAIELIFQAHYRGEPPFQLILLDLEMPGMDGFEFLRQRKHLSRLSEIPVVIVTGQTEEEIRAGGHINAVSVWLGKPVEWRQLERILQSFTRATTPPPPPPDE